MKEHEKLLCIVEGAICIALSYALSFLKFKIWPEGGSIDLVMVPLLVYAWRRGTLWGMGAGLIFPIGLIVLLIIMIQSDKRT